MTMKICNGCKIEKDVSEFYRDERNPHDKYFSRCKSCCKNYHSNNIRPVIEILNNRQLFKTCTKCKMVLESNELNFFVDNYKKDGLSSSCRSCYHDYVKNNKERIKKQRNDYQNQKRLTNIHFKIKSTCCNRINMAIKKGFKSF